MDAPKDVVDRTIEATRSFSKTVLEYAFNSISGFNEPFTCVPTEDEVALVEALRDLLKVGKIESMSFLLDKLIDIALHNGHGEVFQRLLRIESMKSTVTAIDLLRKAVVECCSPEAANFVVFELALKFDQGEVDLILSDFCDDADKTGGNEDAEIRFREILELFVAHLKPSDAAINECFDMLVRKEYELATPLAPFVEIAYLNQLLMSDAECECDAEYHVDRIVWLLSLEQTPSQEAINDALSAAVESIALDKVRALVDSEKPPSQSQIDLAFDKSIDEDLPELFVVFLESENGPSSTAVVKAFKTLVNEPSQYEMLESLLDAKKTELQQRVCRHFRRSIAKNEPELAKVLCRYAPLDLVTKSLEASNSRSEACRVVREILLD
jgi:hypothetical protein